MTGKEIIDRNKSQHSTSNYIDVEKYEFVFNKSENSIGIGEYEKRANTIEVTISGVDNCKNFIQHNHLPFIDDTDLIRMRYVLHK